MTSLNTDHENAIAYKRASVYASRLNAVGGLLGYSEATNLLNNDDMKNKMLGINIGAKDNYLNWWLSTSFNSSNIYYVYGRNGGIYNQSFSSAYDTCVRPVIEIDKSKIS